MANRTPLALGEWYHLYSRGTDRRVVFKDPKDYERFVALLYTSNGTKPVRISDRRNTDLYSILEDSSIDRGEPLVEVGAYALMPTHPHILVRQIQDGGIARFMQKVFTGYTMYFNIKNKRTGALFSGTFKSKHVSDDRYLKQIVSYILLNPIELFETNWKKGVGNIQSIETHLSNYQYSSLADFFDKERLEKKVVNTNWHDYYDSKPNLLQMLIDAQNYYKEQCPEV